MSRIIETEVVFAKGDPKIIDECQRLRKEVFHVEQGFPLDIEFDGRDDIATHFLVCVTEEDEASAERRVKYVGTIRGTPPGTYPGIDRYKLSRLAVHKAYRKYRLGRLLVESLHKWIQADAAASHRPSADIECYSHIPLMGFYAKFGYTVEEKPYARIAGVDLVPLYLCLYVQGPQSDEDGEPHQNMMLRLPAA
ncbi:acyl-CoA N-acyltransferase [Mycena latifolia]|nr:acyl-CoA N-acyltransferase [Mycena latifolia]